ncbi:CAP domain-containing protein [Patulibacter americanus]|uniref:CAP domain-containing protein n=1 Tax=Patulibacter americanus TaxID=588672 RepID=UPI0003B7005E|nr:CAP domain-containing protein [Patulibacter americanus]
MLAIVLALAVVPAASASAACADADAWPADIGGARTTAAVSCLTNEYRASLGLPGYAVDARVTQAAQAHADDMATRGYYAHSTPEGAAFTTWLDTAGVSWQAAGENIARQNTTARDVVQAWIASPAHEANLRAPNFTQAGYAIAFSGQYAFVWVQEFVRPTPVAQAAASASAADTDTEDEDGYDLAAAAREIAAKASASRSGRTLRLRITVPKQRASRTRVTAVVSQRGRVVRRLSTIGTTGHNQILRARLPKAAAGRVVVMVGTKTVVARFR